MAFGREIKMEFERVKVSPEMVGIVGGWLTVLVFVWTLGQDMSDLRTDMSDLRVDMSDLRTELKGDIAHLNGRMARVEGLLEGYIERSRTGEDIAVTE
ncbi:MAG: hypothetical protein OXG03_04775 [Gammaproteobacteria bacterium]|nr:hypothetical protein [Gammaproteobacteria bacterium]